MSDLQQAISLLSDLQTQMEATRPWQDLQRDINTLHQDTAILWQDVARDAMVHNPDQGTTNCPDNWRIVRSMCRALSVGHFKQLAETIYSNFDSWAKTAHSRVIDKVLEIQRPRLKATENKLHKNMCACLHNDSPTSAPVAIVQSSSRPYLCIRVSDEAESEDGSSSEGTNSFLSIETASSGGHSLMQPKCSIAVMGRLGRIDKQRRNIERL